MSLLHLRRIRLINFHNFIDETLKVQGNLFLIGENQSGKTTVLDALHVALTAGVDVELNAASRFGQKTEPGRNLASIILRYDHEKNQPLRPPSVMYVAVEVTDDEDNASTFGVGAFAASMESHPEVWGFIARGKRLEDLDLITQSNGSAGPAVRPRDRAELEAVIGKQSVWEKGRYRTELARYLFRDREAYSLAMDLISAAKAYRALVAKARNINELFVTLLPAPAEEEFEEVRSALRAIDGINSSLTELSEELKVLRFVIQKLQDARKEYERIAKYQFVSAELSWKEQEKQAEQSKAQLGDAHQALSQAEAALAQCDRQIAELESTLRELRASDDSTILAQEEQARIDLQSAEQDAESADQILSEKLNELVRREQEREKALEELNLLKERMRQAILSCSQAAEELLGEGVLAIAAELLQLATELSAGTADKQADRIKSAHAQLQSAFRKEYSEAGRSAAIANQERERFLRQGADLRAEADAIRRRAELLPPLEGYPELMTWLAQNAPGSQPLYRLFEVKPEVSDGLGRAIECWLGPPNARDDCAGA